MELWSRTIALYGRFSPGGRESLAAEVEKRGGRVVRDLTQLSDVLVVGERADSLISNGALLARIETARQKNKAIFAEAAFRNALSAVAPIDPPTFPLATALTASGASIEDARLLSAFDLVSLAGDVCRFADVSVFKTAASLREAGCSATQLVRILKEARRTAPVGRHKVIIANGKPALQWEDGHTTLDGQGLLPLDLDDGGIDDLFEAAILADADGQIEEAIRLFDMCARTDRSDAISLYNLGNIFLRETRWDEAVLAYRRALARDPRLVEARYNLAQALEGLEQVDAAASELALLLETDRNHADALFNLAQLRMTAGELAEARALYERYLLTGPAADWAAKARKAIAYCKQSS